MRYRMRGADVEAIEVCPDAALLLFVATHVGDLHAVSYDGENLHVWAEGSELSACNDEYVVVVEGVAFVLCAEAFELMFDPVPDADGLPHV